MENGKFMIIMATLGFIIIGSCVLGICSYNEMYKMDVNAQMQTYITGIAGPQKAEQKAEDEAELLRIEKERKMALDEELRKSLEREKATKERYEAMNKEYETNNDRQSSSDETKADPWNYLNHTGTYTFTDAQNKTYTIVLRSPTKYHNGYSGQGCLFCNGKLLNTNVGWDSDYRDDYFNIFYACDLIRYPDGSGERWHGGFVKGGYLYYDLEAMRAETPERRLRITKK